MANNELTWTKLPVSVDEKITAVTINELKNNIDLAFHNSPVKSTATKIFLMGVPISGAVTGPGQLTYVDSNVYTTDGTLNSNILNASKLTVSDWKIFVDLNSFKLRDQWGYERISISRNEINLFTTASSLKVNEKDVAIISSWNSSTGVLTLI